MIEVRLPRARVDAYAKGSSVHESFYILAQLREAGIPVRGAVGLITVETGVLELSLDDLGLEEYVFVWRT